MLITVWGPITWYFFHALAEKVKEEHFSTEKDNILNCFKTVSQSLPCPECRAHAQHNWNTFRIQNIQTKNDLKNFFWNFIIV